MRGASRSGQHRQRLLCQRRFANVGALRTIASVVGTNQSKETSENFFLTRCLFADAGQRTRAPQRPRVCAHSVARSAGRCVALPAGRRPRRPGRVVALFRAARAAGVGDARCLAGHARAADAHRAARRPRVFDDVADAAARRAARSPGGAARHDRLLGFGTSARALLVQRRR